MMTSPGIAALFVLPGFVGALHLDGREIYPVAAANGTAALLGEATPAPCASDWSCPSGLICLYGPTVCGTETYPGFTEDTAHFQHWCSPYGGTGVPSNNKGNTLTECFELCDESSTCAAFYYTGGKGYNGMSECGFCASGYTTIPHGRHDYHLFVKSPVAPPAHATGDPHMQNIHGERFDLMKPGKHVLIHIPRGVTADKALLRVQAVARRLGARCSDLYFQDINVTGKWTNSDLHYSAQVVADDTPQWTKFGPVELKVAHGHTEKGVKYLNFYVKHLGRAGAAVGGLLGEDDSAEAATPSAECRKLVSVEKIATRTASELPGASVAIAAM